MKHKNCKSCGHPLRSSRTAEADAPGTRKHYGHGECSTCYRLTNRPIKAPRQKFAGPRPALAALEAERDKYAAARRARGVPAKGSRRPLNRLAA